MHQATRIEIGPSIDNQVSLSRNLQSLRDVVPAFLYLTGFAALEYGMQWSDLSELLSSCSLTAGLNLALLLIYGLWFAPLVFIAVLIDGLWIHPLSFSMEMLLLYCLVVTLIQIAAAKLYRRLSFGSSLTVKERRDFAVFAVVGILTSIALSAVSIGSMFLEKPILWDHLIKALRINFEGFAIGIFFVTPLLIIHVGPWLESALFGIRAEKQTLSDRQPPIRINSQSLAFALSFICLVALAVWLIFIYDVLEAFSIFVLLSAPLVWVALRRGSEGLSIAAPLLLAACIGALIQFDKNPDSAHELLIILLASSLNAYIIAVGVTQTRTIDSQMERRNAILNAVSRAAQEFLGNTGWETGVREAIRRLGEATSVTRVYLIDNRSPNLGGQVGDTHSYEWTNPSLTTDERDQRILDLLRRQMIEDFWDGFSRGAAVSVSCQAHGSQETGNA